MPDSSSYDGSLNLSKDLYLHWTLGIRKVVEKWEFLRRVGQDVVGSSDTKDASLTPTFPSPLTLKPRGFVVVPSKKIHLRSHRNR